MLDQNLVTVEWGLLSVFGVVLTLLIPQANRHRRAYLRTGTRPAYRLAFGWAWRIISTAALVFLALAALSLVGACDAGLVVYVPSASAITSGTRWLWVFVVDMERPRAGLATWLLLAPLVAQGVFLGLVVFGLVQMVPRLKTLRLESAEDTRASIPGTPSWTVIHFVNETPTAVCLHWIDSSGALQHYDPIPAEGAGPPTGSGPEPTDLRGPPLAAHAPGRVGAHGHGGCATRERWSSGRPRGACVRAVAAPGAPISAAQAPDHPDLDRARA